MAADRGNRRLSAEPSREKAYRPSVGNQYSKRSPYGSLDPLLIEQVLMNLTENAVRYTPAGTTIKLSATVKDKDLLVELADYGRGLFRETKRGYSISSSAGPQQ